MLASGPDRVFVGVQRDPTLDLATGQPRNAPQALIPLTSGYSALAHGSANPQRLSELASSVQLVPNPGDPRSWTQHPLR